MWKITGEILNPTWQNIIIYFKGGITFAENQPLEKCYEYVDVNMYMCVHRCPVSIEPEGDVRFCGAGDTGGRCGFQKLNTCPLHKNQVPLTTEQSDLYSCKKHNF